jgi:hypothetical protein
MRMPLIELSREEIVDHKQRLHDAELAVHLRFPSYYDFDPLDIKDELDMSEDVLAAPNLKSADYDIGVATKPDQHHVRLGQSHVLLSTEHATTQWRKDKVTNQRSRKVADVGTAALGFTLARHTDATHITMLGRQTSDPNKDIDHPYRQLLDKQIQTRQYNAFMSLHGIKPGYVTSLDDDRSIDIIVGAGRSPDDYTSDLSETILKSALRFGLRAEVNRRILKIQENQGKYFLEVDEDGEPKTRLLNGPPFTTRGAVEDAAELYDIDVASLQIELVSGLRIVPSDINRNPKLDVVGPAVGFACMRRVITKWQNSHPTGE